MNIRTEWQLYIAKGHGVFNGMPTIHTFDAKDEALAFLADFITAPAIKAGRLPPDAELRAVIRHDHRDEAREALPVKRKKATRSARTGSATRE